MHTYHRVYNLKGLFLIIQLLVLFLEKMKHVSAFIVLNLESIKEKNISHMSSHTSL